MNHSKDRKPSRPDIQEILSRMKSRFLNEENSDNEDCVKEEYIETTSNDENVVKEELIEKSPDDEIAELMLQLNGQVDEELVASIRSRKKIYENQSEMDSTSSITNNSDETEQEKPRIILTLRPNENKPDSYVSSSNLTNYSSNSPKRKKTINDVNTVVQPLKRSSRRSNDSNQSVLKSAIARKERTFNIDVNSKKTLPKKVKKESEDVATVVNIVPDNTSSMVIDFDSEKKNIKDVKTKDDKNEENITDQKKKKKKYFRGGRYNIFKKKSLQKVVKKVVRNQLNPETGNFDIDSSETNSERLSVSVCSDIGTLKSSDRNDQDDMDHSLPINDVEDNLNDSVVDLQDKKINLCLCNGPIEVVIVDEGKVTCKAEDCIDGKLISCNRLAYHLEEYGYMPMLRANVAIPFLTFCVHHLKRFFLHQSCPRCGRFCSEGIFMMCKNKHFSHIGCHQKDKGCLHCGVADVYDLEVKRHVINKRKSQRQEKNIPEITVEIGGIKLTNINCPPEIDVSELSKHLQQLKDDITNSKCATSTVHGLYEACELNDVQKCLSIIGAKCNFTQQFSNKHNRTALHAACSHGNLMIVYLLLQAGVDPNVVDDKMKSPMRMAAKSGHSNVIQYLMNFNGAPEIKDMQGMTSLHLAAKCGNYDCCKVILSKRASMVNWKDNGGWTPLVWACENGHSDVVQYFYTHNPNPRIPDDENNVALHWAAISGCLDVVKHVVAYDSEVNMFNDAGDTALHIAARKNDANIVSFLLEKGAMAWHRNKGKKRPIDCCLPNTKCYNVLKNVLPEQRKPVTIIQPLVIVETKCIKSGIEKYKTPVLVKTTPSLVSEDITHGCEDFPIRCVNEIDDELPVEFTYIKENCYDVGNYVDSAMSHIASCNCEGACNTNNCKCVQTNGECLYDENGRLNSDFDYFNPSVIIYECNWRCKCHKQRCGNRVIQKGIKVKLELYKHKDMGWGIRTLQFIPRGTFVCEYVGEIIADQKANDLKEDSYLFNLENPGATELYCIDAYNYSNVSRFINHSCDPNLMSVRSFINHHDKRFPRIAFFAVQDIQESEQLSYDYGTAFWKIKRGLFTCKCNKANCSFSEETINSLHIDSDNEEDLDENTEQTTIDKIPSNNELLNQDAIVTNEVDRNLQCSKTKLSKKNNLSKQKNKHPKSFNNKSISIGTNGFKKNNTKNTHINKSISKNRLLLKNKYKKNCAIKKSMSNHLLKFPSRHSKILGSKLIQNKLQNAFLRKELDIQMLNGNSSPEISKNMKITRKKLSLEKDKISRIVTFSSESVKLKNKSNTTYVLRPKVLNSNRQIIENVIQDIVLKNNDFEKDINVVSDTSGNGKKIVSDSNDNNQAEINFIKIEPINKESDTKINYVNRGQKSAKCIELLGTSKEECYKIKTVECIDKNSCNKVCFTHTDQNQLNR